MGFKCGIVGLPNVGKSTLFNALTETAAAQAANYPFCTIEPNVGEVAVPDPRLDTLAQAREVGADHADAAHLRRHRRAGARRLEGRGPRQPVPRHIREVDAIAHVVRCFEDADITHVEGKIDPIADIDTIETELMLADLDSLERRVDALEKRAKQQRQGGEGHRSISSSVRWRCCARASRRGSSSASRRRRRASRMLGLLTSKPVLYVCNVEEASAAAGNDYSRKVEARAKEEGAVAVVISAQDRSRDRGAAARRARGLSRRARPQGAGPRPADPRRLRASHLVTYFTAGPKEARAWTITRGTKAPQAAGVIHTDFERGFIRAETIAYDDYVKFAGEAGARDAGKLRLEGKEYVVADGDVMHFRFAT